MVMLTSHAAVWLVRAAMAISRPASSSAPVMPATATMKAATNLGVYVRECPRPKAYQLGMIARSR
jgi:hypothetical protein